MRCSILFREKPLLISCERRIRTMLNFVIGGAVIGAIVVAVVQARKNMK